MVNGLKKNRGMYKPTKREGPIEQGVVKTQLEIVEVSKAALCSHIFSLQFLLTVECPSLT